MAKMVARHMKRVRYQLKDLRFVKGKAAKVDDRLTKQEAIIARSRHNGTTVDLDIELLARLYDIKRRVIDRLRAIEAALDAKS